jgi:hypothetical protein
MLYLKSDDGSIRVIVLETKNIEEIMKGRPAKSQDGQVLIAWTPDPVWLADKIMEVADGDMVKIGKLIDEAAKRPQKPTERPKHGDHLHRFLGEEK